MKKVWKSWVLELKQSNVQVVRNVDGRLILTSAMLNSHHCPRLWLAPADARRLYTKLSADYRD